MAARQMRLTPELVAKVPPYTGEYRPEANAPRSDELDQAAADAILGNLPDDGRLWVFAFGSLIWKPGPEFGERRPGRVRGWHRAFCLGWDRAFRGNPDSPGLMLSLDRGGQCEGLALEVMEGEQGLRANLLAILRREPPFPTPWVTVKVEGGTLRALAFANDRKSPFYVGGLSNEEIADAIAKATGKFGAMAEYLYNTVTHFEAAGIHDAHLWEMQELVAERLERLDSPAV
ncbi:MAG: gamma-glutamylcyclotransferase [Devosia sp.]